MSKISDSIKLLEKLSLISCSKEVLWLLERALTNVEPITTIATEGKGRLIWQNGIDMRRLHKDQVNVKMNAKDLRRNAAGYFEDYISIGLTRKTKNRL